MQNFEGAKCLWSVCCKSCVLESRRPLRADLCPAEPADWKGSVPIKGFSHPCRNGAEGSVCRMPPAHHRQIPAQGHRLPLARGVRAVRGVRGRAPELLLSAGPQTLLQAGLC